MKESKEELRILANRIMTPDGTILHSTHRWDCQTHTDTVTGEYYMIDGGNDYVRGSVNKIPAKSLLVTTRSPHEEIRNVFMWTRRYDADMNLLPEPERIPLKDITDSHLSALVDWTSGDYINRIMVDEKFYRDTESK
jgi:hypothetical protein